MIGIIGAMPSEVDALRREMTDAAERKVGFSRIWEGTLCGRKTALALCGIGKVHAALCAQAMLLLIPDYPGVAERSLEIAYLQADALAQADKSGACARVQALGDYRDAARRASPAGCRRRSG